MKSPGHIFRAERGVDAIYCIRCERSFLLTTLADCVAKALNEGSELISAINNEFPCITDDEIIIKNIIK